MIALERLLMLSLGELDDPEAAPVEEHVLACAACASTLERLLRIGDGVRALVHAGGLPFFASVSVLDELGRAGLVTRTFRLGPGETVACTVTAEDIYAASYMTANLSRVARVDVVRRTSHGTHRTEDVPFDATRGVVGMVLPGAFLRTLPTEKGRVVLYAVDPSGERELGEYTFDHTAYRP